MTVLLFELECPYLLNSVVGSLRRDSRVPSGLNVLVVDFFLTPVLFKRVAVEKEEELEEEKRWKDGCSFVGVLAWLGDSEERAGR
jgi:hypothetical protein